MCRITIDGEPSRFNTKANVNPDIWDAKAGIAIGKSNEAVEVNALLNTIKTSHYCPVKVDWSVFEIIEI